MKEKIDQIIEALEEKKAEDIVVLDLRNRNQIGDFHIVATGSNPNQTRAIAQNLLDLSDEKDLEWRNTEGFAQGEWILLDFSDIIVHIFLPKTRDYYNLERLWQS